jgi:hypothetical protein
MTPDRNFPSPSSESVDILLVTRTSRRTLPPPSPGDSVRCRGTLAESVIFPPPRLFHHPYALHAQRKRKRYHHDTTGNGLRPARSGFPVALMRSRIKL